MTYPSAVPELLNLSLVSNIMCAPIRQIQKLLEILFPKCLLLMHLRLLAPESSSCDKQANCVPCGVLHYCFSYESPCHWTISREINAVTEAQTNADASELLGRLFTAVLNTLFLTHQQQKELVPLISELFPFAAVSKEMELRNWDVLAFH